MCMPTEDGEGELNNQSEKEVGEEEEAKCGGGETSW